MGTELTAHCGEMAVKEISAKCMDQHTIETTGGSITYYNRIE